ncbi:hypothetical protein [Nesterenkonia sp. DZ6]|uniref:hypothetical protein n=1 Tax=Nesterenkonia sp. DZ6 TaxID=2901229 RepID=UPI001F4C6FA3|nr:hypothetical protein [Nesterenkonia sp. DZ6]MCH8560291.1 hypothetical protein [Nesterenkonia sp. DZ6]
MSRALPEAEQLFRRFDSDNASDGAARDRFEQFVSDLVAVRWIDATTVAANNHNDWGIDTFVGELDGGKVQVWQSKYIRHWQNASPQNQVRESFRSASKKAKEENYTIVEWTLVVPAILHPQQMKWFLGWAGRCKRETGTKVKLWQGDQLRRQLMSSESINVRREYFPHTVDSLPLQRIASPDVALTEDYAAFDNALFVRQLQASGFEETSAACGMFFATEALRRDLEAKEAATELQALRTVQLDVHGIWEMRFNEHAPSASADGMMPALYGQVIGEAASTADAPGLVLQRAHKQGAAHMLVEEGRAGWVKHWRHVAEEHRGDMHVSGDRDASDSTPDRDPHQRTVEEQPS